MTDQKRQPRGILTPADREYLVGEKQLSQGAERNRRMEIRKRVRTSLDDFELLWSLLPDDDLEQIFYPDDENRRHQIRSVSQHAIAFILLGLWKNRDPHFGRLEDAFQQAAFESGWLASVDLEITTEKAPESNLIPAKIRHKEDRIQELRYRLNQKPLSESKRRELQNELQNEVTFCSLLFEEAFCDPSVDAEAIASLTFDGEEIGIRPEEVEQSQKAEVESPIVRKLLPIITDVKPIVDSNDVMMNKYNEEEEE